MPTCVWGVWTLVRRIWDVSLPAPSTFWQPISGRSPITGDFARLCIMNKEVNKNSWYITKRLTRVVIAFQSVTVNKAEVLPKGHSTWAFFGQATTSIFLIHISEAKVAWVEIEMNGIDTNKNSVQDVIHLNRIGQVKTNFQEISVLHLWFGFRTLT